MNLAVVLTIVRQILLAVGTYLTTSGIITDASLVEPAVGGFLALVSIVWGVLAKKKDQDKIQDLKASQ